MKKGHLLFLLTFLSVLAGILLLVRTRTTHPDLSEQEKLALEKLPGYFFVFEGKTNHIMRAKSHETLMEQHPMMPYLELVVDRLGKRPWARDWPIRMQETETQIIITLPSWMEQLGMTGPTVFDAGYELQVIIDKKTKKIISALQG